jgi:hypothetical protein
MSFSELDRAIFRRSTFCAKDACVEVAVTSDNEFLVRDSKDRRADAPVLRFDAEEWRAFALGMAAGEFSAER